MSEERKPAQRVEVITFRRQQSKRTDRAKRHERRLMGLRTATVAKRLALAHRIEREIESGKYKDQADVARQHGLTRARMTQLLKLRLLAPDIQEQVLALRFPVGREPITERTLRVVLESLVWGEQRGVWSSLASSLST